MNESTLAVSGYLEYCARNAISISRLAKLTYRHLLRTFTDMTVVVTPTIA